MCSSNQRAVVGTVLIHRDLSPATMISSACHLSFPHDQLPPVSHRFLLIYFLGQGEVTSNRLGRLTQGLHQECVAVAPRKNLMILPWVRTGNGATPGSTSQSQRMCFGENQCAWVPIGMSGINQNNWKTRSCDIGSPALGGNEVGSV